MKSFKIFNGLPIDYESFITERYDSFITSCRYIEIYNATSEKYYMQIFENEKLIELLIFEKNGSTIKCLNELVYIDQEIIDEFSKFIFKDFPTIKKIKIISSYNKYALNKSILFRKGADYIINLPSTIDGYYQELGQSTRQHIKNYKKRLLREYPEVNFITKTGKEIEEDIIDKIMRLNFNRAKLKGEIPNKNHTHKNNIYKLSQHYGCVSYIEIDGLIVAGCISFVSYKNITLYIIGHDNNFSKYNIGQLCLVHLIQTSIEKGFSVCHLLWGEREYKTRFLAKPYMMNSYIIYRSYSLNFIVDRVKVILSDILTQIKLSKYAKPLKNKIIELRKKSALKLSKLEFIL